MTKKEYIQQAILIQRKYEVKFYPRVKRAIQAEVTAVANIVQNNGVNEGIQYASKIVTIPELPQAVEKLYNEVGMRFARRQWIQLRGQQKAIEQKAFGFNQQWVTFIREYLLKFLTEKITFAVAETTREAILKVLNQSIAEGWGLARTVAALDDMPLTAMQAARIVRTEVTRAANTGVMAAGSTFQFEQSKEWIAANDRRTRGQNPKDHASHVGLDGIKIDFEDVFIDPRNGDQLRFPGDPQASAASTVNCRCNIAVVAKVDKSGRLIPKRKTTAVIFANQRVRRQIITI